VFDPRVIGEQEPAQANDPPDLPFRVGGAQVQMQPVLVVLVRPVPRRSTSTPWRLRGSGSGHGELLTPRIALRHRHHQHAFRLGQSVRQAGS
jgi:hypothetical protein